jgi:aspartate/methionine/tyrosine aminotransferase
MLGLAENSMMHEDVTEYIQRHVGKSTPNKLVQPNISQIRTQGNISPVYHLTYGKGPRGSTRLRKALAQFFNTNFKSHNKVEYGEVLVLSGVSSAVDSLTWAICNDGEGVIIPRPVYTGFKIDVSNRSHGVIVPASYYDVEGYRGLDDSFDADVNGKALEAAFEKAQKDGIVPRAVILVKCVYARILPNLWAET